MNVARQVCRALIIVAVLGGSSEHRRPALLLCGCARSLQQPRPWRGGPPAMAVRPARQQGETAPAPRLSRQAFPAATARRRRAGAVAPGAIKFEFNQRARTARQRQALRHSCARCTDQSVTRAGAHSPCAPPLQPCASAWRGGSPRAAHARSGDIGADGGWPVCVGVAPACATTQIRLD